MTEPCLQCRGAGFVYADVSLGHPDFGRAVPCPDCNTPTDEERKAMWLKVSGIPPARMGYTFANFKDVAGAGECKQAAQQFASGETDKKCLLLYGDFGCGKTHLAIAITKAMIDRGIRTRFLKVADLLSELKKAMDTEDNVEEIVDSYKEIPCLVIDDLGQEYESKWAVQKVEEIICSRWEDKKWLVVTTNKDLRQLAGRVKSRLVDYDISWAVKNTAPDYRTTKR